MIGFMPRVSAHVGYEWRSRCGYTLLLMPADAPRSLDHLLDTRSPERAIVATGPAPETVEQPVGRDAVGVDALLQLLTRLRMWSGHCAVARLYLADRLSEASAVPAPLGGHPLVQNAYGRGEYAVGRRDEVP